MNTNAAIIQIFLQSKENQVCVDCQTNPSAFISITHGVFICESCAEIHNTLHFAHQIKSLESPLTPTDISYMSHGGNSNFLSFLSSYNIPSYSKIPFKYSRVAVGYYTKHLESLTQNTFCELTSPTMEEALKTMNEPESPKFFDSFLETIEKGSKVFSSVVDNEGFKDVREKTSGFFCDLQQGIKAKARVGAESLDSLVQLGKETGDKILRKVEEGKDVIVSTAEKGKEGVGLGIFKGKQILMDGFEYIKSGPFSPTNKK